MSCCLLRRSEKQEGLVTVVRHVSIKARHVAVAWQLQGSLS